MSLLTSNKLIILVCIKYCSICTLMRVSACSLAIRTRIITSANSLMLDTVLIPLTTAGVSDTNTTFGLDDIRCWLRMAFFRQRNTACKALLDLKRGCRKVNESFKPIPNMKVDLATHNKENACMLIGSFFFFLHTAWKFCINNEHKGTASKYQHPARSCLLIIYSQLCGFNILFDEHLMI